MHVTVTTAEDTKGLFFKKPVYRVHYHVVFSDEELAIIKERRLSGLTVFQYVYDPHTRLGTAIVPLYGLIKKTHTVRDFDTSIEAQAFAIELKEKIFPRLKKHLDFSGSSVQKTDS